ncbi:MAG TPA: ATP-binding protein [Kaistiaceae bacterium]|nr:ATP-binding protein [Kaistiaceae bacterium]
MPALATQNPFQSEEAWPFALREKDMEQFFSFLTAKSASEPRILRIFGESGTGKSFFARDLLCRIASRSEVKLAIYIDTPPSELESSGIFRKIDQILQGATHPTRSHPQFVTEETAARWRRTRTNSTTWHKTYGYGVARDLTAQIPVVGPFIKAFLPSILPGKTQKDSDDLQSLRFIVKLSQQQPVLLVLDNVQFISSLSREFIERELTKCGRKFRLILVERVTSGSKLNWRPIESRGSIEDLNLSNATQSDVLVLVRAVLPDRSDHEQLSKVIHRRSDGNLKYVWFQLKFLSERKSSQPDLITASSYENVIQSLGSIENLVLRLVVFLLGGISIAQVHTALKALNIGIEHAAVANALGDLVAMGLIAINSERRDKVRVEHELVSRVVTELTPEEEKLEFREQLVEAIGNIIDGRGYNSNVI